MDRDEFFSKIVDGYLFCDLRNMATLKQKKGEKGGAAGYPMIATIIPAMELLGGLLQPDTYSDGARDGRGYFKYYWENYLEKVNPSYSGFADIFYDLIRHGTAHTFITKIGITVTKRQPNYHLAYQDGDTKMLNVDCVVLYKDFRKSYTLVKRRLRNKKLAQHVQDNINLLLSQSRTKSDNVFTNHSVATSIQQTSVGPSGPTPSGVSPLNTATTTYIPDDVRLKIKNMSKAITTNTAAASGASLITQETAESLKKSLQDADEYPVTLSGL